MHQHTGKMARFGYWQLKLMCSWESGHCKQREFSTLFSLSHTSIHWSIFRTLQPSGSLALYTIPIWSHSMHMRALPESFAE